MKMRSGVWGTPKRIHPPWMGYGATVTDVSVQSVPF